MIKMTVTSSNQTIGMKGIMKTILMINKHLHELTLSTISDYELLILISLFLVQIKFNDVPLLYWLWIQFICGVPCT